MTPTRLFLLRFFQDLRENTPLDLDIEQYQLLFKALYLRLEEEEEVTYNWNQLLNLCKILWLSNPELEQIFEDIFKKYFKQKSALIKVSKEAPSLKIVKAADKNKVAGSPSSEITTPITPTPPAYSSSLPAPGLPQGSSLAAKQASEDVYIEFSDIPSIIDLDKQVWQNMEDDNLDIDVPNTFIFAERGHLPVPARRMQQSWRYLKYHHEKVNDQIVDFNQTVNDIAQKGHFSKLFFQKKRNFKDFDCHFLTDHSGSMITFLKQADQIVDSLKASLPQVPIFRWYFNDYPEQFLFKDIYQVHGEKIEDWLKNLKKKSFIFFISDAGAVKGAYQMQRIKEIYLLIEQIKKITPHLLWFNPIPMDRWHHSSAIEISGLIKMIPITKTGLAGLYKEIKQL